MGQKNGAITKSFFSKLTDRLELKCNATLNFPTMEIEHGNIKTYFTVSKLRTDQCAPTTEGIRQWTMYFLPVN